VAAVVLSRTDAVEASLRSQRAELDAQLAQAVTQGADPALLRDGLGEIVVVAEQAGGTGELLDAVVAALVGQVCALAGRGVGASSAERYVLREVIGLLGPWLRSDPSGCLGQVNHAARVLARRPGAFDAWVRRLGTAAACTDDAAQLRELGVVAAWRSGLVRLRDAALQAAHGLPADALDAVLELPGEAESVLRANAADPWAWPGGAPRPGELRVVARSGGFTGFGGPWPVPPVVTGGDGVRWRVRAGPVERLLLWDVHGDAVVPIQAAALDTCSDPAAVLGPPGMLRLAGLSAPAPWQDEVTGAVVVGRTAVLSRSGSHYLDLLRAGGAP
jgi:hypothetical protein